MYRLKNLDRLEQVTESLPHGSLKALWFSKKKKRKKENKKKKKRIIFGFPIKECMGEVNGMIHLCNELKCESSISLIQLYPCA